MLGVCLGILGGWVGSALGAGGAVGRSVPWGGMMVSFDTNLAVYAMNTASEFHRATIGF